MFEYRLASIITVLTFFLILLGGFVHNTGASLACPDWPLCFGSFFPKMVGGVLFEHSHRLVASLIGLLTIILVLVAGRRRSSELKQLTRVALLLVIFQGLLGGITVIYQLPTLVSVAHLATSMLFFLLMITISYRLNPSLSLTTSIDSSQDLRPYQFAGCVTLLVYLQMVLGALVRHSGAGLSCLEIPLCLGSLWPAGVDGMVQLHMAHRIGGLVTGIAVAFFVIKHFFSVKQGGVFLLPLLWVLLEITLGLLTVSSQLGIWQVTSHLGVGTLLLSNLWWLVLHNRYRTNS